MYTSLVTSTIICVFFVQNSRCGDYLHISLQWVPPVCQFLNYLQFELSKNYISI